MGEVYLARRVWTAGFERAVVIKRVLPHLAGDPQANAAFLDEARLMAMLRHPNIVDVMAVSRDEGELYLVMEFLRGETLSGLRRELVGCRERLDPALAIHIVSEVCAGLHAAHELVDEEGRMLHVVHRDVSPQNVFVTFSGEVKLLDFGIASFVGRSQTRTHTGTAKGKFAYMAPEQFGGGDVDRRADVFAAGILLHELVTGRRLFARESEAQVMSAVLMDPIPLPSQIVDDGVLIPEALDEVCTRALARDPAGRFSTADAMRAALRELMPALDPRQRAPDRLIEITRRVLPDRFAASQHLLRRASAESGDFAAIAMDQAATVCAGPEPSSPPVRTPSPLTTRAAWLTAVAAITLAAAIALTATTLTERFAPVIAPHAPPLVASAALPTQGTDGAGLELVSDIVSVEIETVPAAGSISIGGAPRGTAPLTIELERSNAPVDIVIEREGYVTWRESVVPDADRRLTVRLVRARRASRPPRPFYTFDDPPESVGHRSPDRGEAREQR